MGNEFTLLNDCLPAHHGQRLRGLLNAAAGIEMVDSQRGELSLGDGVARIELLANDHLHAVYELAADIMPQTALEMSGQLPGNMRLAQKDRKLLVRADTLIDGEAHLPITLQRMVQGIHAARRREAVQTVLELDPGVVEQALSATDWSGEALVKLERGWEVQVALPRGQSARIDLRLAGAELCFRRTVLSSFGCLAQCAVIASQALRQNSVLQHVRLSVVNDQIVAETRLHEGLLDRRWLQFAARAVAVAYQHTALPLQLLAEQAEVARHYPAAPAACS